jgi:PPOX class probable F420-dependent enzyme
VTTLDDLADLLAREHGLCVVTTLRPDLAMQSSVVNAGVMTNPITGEASVAFVAAGRSRKLVHLRDRPQVTLTARAAWEWATVEGVATVIGPDDPSPHFDADGLRVLLRNIFIAAGGTHDDWDEYDRVMAAQRRTAVFITPTRIYSNG